MARRARVLWLAKGLGRGGTERLLVSAIPHIDEDRYDVQVAYVLPWKDALVPELTAYGTTVHCLGGKKRAGIGWVMGLRTLVQRGRFDIVHTHMPQPAIAARLVLRRPRPVILHTEHNVWSRYRWPTRVLNQMTYRVNDVVLPVSESVAHSIHGGRLLSGERPRIEVLLHGIDIAAIHRGEQARIRARKRLGLTGECIVGTVGNLTPKKDHRSLLEAVSRLVPFHDDLRCVLIGSGPLENELRTTADRLGLGSRIIFGGSRDDVLELLPAFDIFVLSSIYEGFSIALLEAMASGLPCVATRVGGAAEVISDGIDGLLVPPAQVASLTDAVDRLLRDKSLRTKMGDLAADRAAQFEISRAVVRMQAIYDEILVSK